MQFVSRYLDQLECAMHILVMRYSMIVIGIAGLILDMHDLVIGLHGTINYNYSKVQQRLLKPAFYSAENIIRANMDNEDLNQLEDSTPVREWLDTFQKNLSEETLTNLQVFLGVVAQPVEQSWLVQPVEALASIFPFPAVSSILEFTNDQGGNTLIVFPKDDAAWIGSGHSGQAEEKQDGDPPPKKLEGPAFDSFAEVCKQLSGTIDQVIRQTMNDDMGLEYKSTEIVEHYDESNFPFETSHFILFPVQAEIENHGTISFYFTISSNPLEKWFGQKIDWGLLHEEPKKVQETSPAGISTLFIRLHGDCDVQLQKMLEEDNLDYVSIESFGQLRTQIESHEIKLLIIQTENREETGIKMCRRIIQRYLNDRSIPIWIQGAHWESSLVRSAWEAGADLCVKIPIDRELMRDKLQEAIRESQ